MDIAKIVLPPVLLILLSSCGSTPPSNYYMLSAEAPGMPGTGGPSIGVGPVDIPEYLQRKLMVLNRDSHRLTLSESDRWAEPLKEGIARVVALNLAVLLDTQQVQRYPWRRFNAPRYGISMQVVQFSMHGAQAELVTEWSLRDIIEDVLVRQKISKFTTRTAADDAYAMAGAYSKLLLQLSEEIAAATREHAGASP